jgi:stage II sporulation protein AA (anti-sigma F factor antagonist)
MGTAHHPSLEIEIATGSVGALKLALRGELDLASAPVLVSRIVELAGSWRAVSVDVSGLSFMDLAGLRALLASKELAGQARCRVEITGPPQRPVRRLLELVDFGADLMTSAAPHDHAQSLRRRPPPRRRPEPRRARSALPCD